MVMPPQRVFAPGGSPLRILVVTLALVVPTVLLSPAAHACTPLVTELGCPDWDAGTTHRDRACGEGSEGGATVYWAWVSMLGGVSLSDWSCDGREGATLRADVASVYAATEWTDTGAHGDPCRADTSARALYTSVDASSVCPRDVVPTGVGWGPLLP